MISPGHWKLGGLWGGDIIKHFFLNNKANKKISPLFIITSNGEFLTSVIKTLLPQICCLSKFQTTVVGVDFS